jgi:2-polyprenyl-6-methoxyphenol hydroxylase-like FAD-dependent oxidoreductase
VLAARSPLERPGDLALLRRHERARRADVDAMQFVTDRLEWLFGIEARPAAFARNLGLRGIDALPPAKRLLAARAMR